MSATGTETLFGADAADAVPEGVLRELADRFGKKPEAVARWGRARAVATLEQLRKEERALVNRLAADAGERPAEPAREGLREDVYRLHAAEWCEKAAEVGPDEAALACSAAVLALPEDRVLKLAVSLAKALREKA